MGLSYNIIPTCEMDDRIGYLEHFKSIETYQFPDNYEIDKTSRYPTVIEVEDCLIKSGCIIASIAKEDKIDKLIRNYRLKHLDHPCESDFTIYYFGNQVNVMMGIYGDFNILLRITTELAKICGSMIIWSAYDAHYIEAGKNYEQFYDIKKYLG